MTLCVGLKIKYVLFILIFLIYISQGTQRVEKDHLNKFELGVDGRSLQTWPPINQNTLLAISFLKFIK